MTGSSVTGQLEFFKDDDLSVSELNIVLDGLVKADIAVDITFTIGSTTITPISFELSI